MQTKNEKQPKKTNETLLNHHHHHHHHLFWKGPFLPCSARIPGLDVCLDMKSLHISFNFAHSGCKSSSFMSSFTLSSSLPAPAFTLLRTTAIFLYTGRHPIILTLMFQMPKPFQSATRPTPHHLSHTRNIPNRLYKTSLRFLSFNSACVHSVLAYGTEMWTMKAENLHHLERVQCMRVRWMHGVSGPSTWVSP